MVKQKPIYVRSDIETTMDEIWEYSQNPNLHTVWDLRFTEISYLERKENEPQRFLYKTKIGFGLEIAGKGESTGEICKDTGERISSLKFWTKHPLSLIRFGRGYWKYTQQAEKVVFETQYDYETSFGKFGEVLDTLLFRPLIGWATAWSFDSLKLWLEKGYHPRLSLLKTLTYWTVCLILAFVWLYQGLVPKLLFVHTEEVKMFSSLVASPISDALSVQLIGILEIIFGIIWLFPINKRKLFIVHICMLCLLTVSAYITNAPSFIAPFNPITLNVMLVSLSFIGYLNSGNLPSASNCRRSRGEK